MKLSGTVLILICFAMMGSRIRYKFKNRIVCLEEILIMLDIIRSQICFVNTDIKSLIIMLSNDENLKKLNFLSECKTLMESNNDFVFAWNNAIDSAGSSLNETDIQLLKSFGSQLGKSDVQGQINNCLLHIERFKNRLDDAQLNFKKYGNLYFNLSILSGLLVSIILI